MLNKLKCAFQHNLLEHGWELNLFEKNKIMAIEIQLIQPFYISKIMMMEKIIIPTQYKLITLLTLNMIEMLQWKLKMQKERINQWF